VPLYSAVGHIHNRPYFVALFRLDVDILLLLLLADRSIVAVVADTVGFFEAELFIFAFVSDNPNDDIVVFDEDYADVEVESAFTGKVFVVEELVGGTVQFLYLLFG
jgi:hypothetical protein